MNIPVVEGADLELAYRNLNNRQIFDVRTEYGASMSDDGVLEEKPLIDRQQLDSVVFDALDLTQGERDGVYEAVVNLVEARLSKAKSLQE